MKRSLRLIEFILPLTAIMLLVFQVILSNELSTHGKQVGELEKEVRLAKDEKEALTIEVASASSLLTLRDRAEVLGFIEPTTKQILTLTPQVPVAIRP